MNGFMTIPGFHGGSVDALHPDSFEITELGFSVSRSGTGAPNWTFAATVRGGVGLPQLLEAAASQTILPSIPFQFDVNSARSFIALALTNARITSTGTAVSRTDNSVLATLSFAFSSIAFDVGQLKPDGTVTRMQNTFDSLGNASVPASTAPVSYALNGASGDEQITAFTPQTEQAGAGGGPTAFGPTSIVGFTFDFSTLNSVALIVTGVSLPEAHILFFGVNRPSPTLTYDFNNVSTFSVGVSGMAPTVSFAGDQLHWTTVPLQPDGTFGTPITAGWQVSTNSAL
jgi:hypothetical protein